MDFEIAGRLTSVTCMYSGTRTSRTKTGWPMLKFVTKIDLIMSLRIVFIDLRTSPSLGGAQSFFGE